MKKISHEEARNVVDVRLNSVDCSFDGCPEEKEILNNYITLQMQKDNIVQKEHELFERTKEKHELFIKYDHTSDENLQEELADELYKVDMQIDKIQNDIKNLKWLYDLSDEVK